MSDKNLTWLHLSDFHVGKDGYAERKMFDYILSHVKNRKEKGVVPDFLFFTGDLADKGLSEQYQVLWEELIIPLQQEIGDCIENRTFVVPGNHDVNRRKNPAFSREEIRGPNSRYFDPTEEGAQLRGEMLIPRFKAYLDNDLTLLGEQFSQPEGAWTACLTRNGVEVGIVGINTAWLSKDGSDERQLTPGKALLENSINAIKSTEFHIVLGHHPVDWFFPTFQRSIKSLLAQCHAVYLHGHLHDVWVEPTYGNGNEYLAIQSGAGFQAREGEPWRNGLVWGQVDMIKKKVSVQPYNWVSDGQEWRVCSEGLPAAAKDGEWWSYALPGSKSIALDYKPAQVVSPPPKGWAIVTPEDLVVYVRPLEESVALRYFDGAVPDWSTVLSTSICRRGIVNDLIQCFESVNAVGKPNVTLLLAAGCEGKSTALLQAAYEIVSKKEKWRIMHRRDESQPLNVESMIPLLDKESNWLLLIDEADNAAADVYRLLSELPDTQYGQVHAILACRDTDWLTSSGDQIEFSSMADFHKKHLTGLDINDAELIVQSWKAYGKEGLGDLESHPEIDRASILERQAKEEAKTQAGAFFGALLAARNGSDLQKRARIVLERLSRRTIPGGKTLRDALAHIAVMHAEGLEYLSRPVLAEALACPLNKLHREVLVPLGQEAAATTTSSFIFTRHQRIAKNIAFVLENEFGEDLHEIYVSLSRAAIACSVQGVTYIPELSSWRYDISNHFLDTDRTELAFSIAHAVLAEEPDNIQTRTHVANLYRRKGVPGLAVRIFRQVSDLVESRAFYHEWGVAEGECNRMVESIVLDFYSLSDQCHFRKIDRKQANMSLTGLAISLSALHYTFGNNYFQRARMAAICIGVRLAISEADRKFYEENLNFLLALNIPRPNVEILVSQLRSDIFFVEELGLDPELSDLIPKLGNLSFDGLSELLENSPNFGG